jgi:hypothetical protein
LRLRPRATCVMVGVALHQIFSCRSPSHGPRCELGRFILENRNFRPRRSGVSAPATRTALIKVIVRWSYETTQPLYLQPPGLHRVRVPAPKSTYGEEPGVSDRSVNTAHIRTVASLMQHKPCNNVPQHDKAKNKWDRTPTPTTPCHLNPETCCEAVWPLSSRSC